MFYWHVHHNRLIEECYSYEERAAAIKTTKPASEIPLRLKLMQPVKGALPPAFLQAWAAHEEAMVAYRKAMAALDGAWAAREGAWAAHEKAMVAYRKAMADWDKAKADWEGAREGAWAAYRKAMAARDKARADWEEALKHHWPEIVALHAQECPDCPWNGHTIFPQG